MKILENLLDPYDRRARLAPMLIALAPVIVLLTLYIPGITNLGLKSATILLVYGTLSTLLASRARQAGQRLELKLKEKWGGWPSMMIFRHRDHRINAITKSNIHLAMAKTVPSTYAPTPQQEAENPTQCDTIYLAWSEELRKRARNRQKDFPHVFKENMSYGFHRNLRGLKPFAITVLLISLVTTAFAAWWKFQSAQAIPIPEVSCFGAFVLALCFWVFSVTHNSVMLASYDYAARLIDDCVPDLPAKGATSRKRKADSA